MDVLYLPYTEWSDSMQTAMQRMKSFDSRWLVVHHRNDEYRLHANRAVLDARAKGVEKCDGLRDFPGELVVLILDDLAKGSADHMWELVESTLDQKNANYGLPFWPDGRNPVIAVTTRHENLGDAIRTTVRVCGCVQGHDYSEPPPVDGTSCQYDGTDIVCL
jgi:hypothetical protein